MKMMKSLVLAMALASASVAMAGENLDTKYSGLLSDHAAKVLTAKGQCADGASFELKAYENGVKTKNYGSMNLYDYKGPLGTGYLPSKVSMAEAKVFVCKETSERWMPDDTEGRD
jgi:hypothetical protein